MTTDITTNRTINNLFGPRKLDLEADLFEFIFKLLLVLEVLVSISLFSLLLFALDSFSSSSL